MGMLLSWSVGSRFRKEERYMASKRPVLLLETHLYYIKLSTLVQ